MPTGATTSRSRELDQGRARAYRADHDDPERFVLDLAHQLAGACSLIPAHKSYIGQRHISDSARR